MTETGKRLREQLAGLEPVPVEWAPGHSAPYVSLAIVEAVVEVGVQAIRAEATAAAEQRLRERIEREPMYDENDRITAMNGTVREPRTMADATEAYRARVLALFSDAPPPASPRQGEPVEDHHVFLGGKCCCGETEAAALSEPAEAGEPA